MAFSYYPLMLGIVFLLFLEGYFTALASESETPAMTKALRSYIRESKSLAHEARQVAIKLETGPLCGHHTCVFARAYYDKVIDKCRCPWGPLFIINSDGAEDRLHPGANCRQKIECDFPRIPAFDPNEENCTCSVYSLPPRRGFVHDVGDKDPLAARLLQVTRSGFSASGAPMQRSTANQKHRSKRQEAVGAADKAPTPALPAYMPPAKTDITPALIEQSLTIQPQKNAIVHSVIPHFGDGVISFHVQLDGPIVQTLELNATDSLPCDQIGTLPDPNLILVPQTVVNGTEEVTIPDCLIIAVNKYNASWINYWVTKTDGSNTIFSLLGDAQIHDIDQLDTGKPAALSIRVSRQLYKNKRAETANTGSTHIERQQIFPTACDGGCPSSQMIMTMSANGLCGCISEVFESGIQIAARGIEPPNPSTAVMSAQACAGMSCINNANKPAIFNPFTSTCWCVTPAYVEVNEAAHNGA